VKFLLATTDPQKLPVTVLSRCLQFNLKRLPAAEIAAQLERILAQEGVASEPAALALIAQAADGSMRDALSLLDQLIAFGAGKAGEAEARAMLGTIARDHVVRIVELLARADTAELLRCAQALEQFAPDYAQVLDELAALLVRVGLRQALAAYEGDERYAPELLARLAGALTPEDVQLFYQTAIVGRRDLALAPDPMSGFQMTLLRMIAFRPAGAAEGRGAATAGAATPLPPSAPRASAAAPARAAEPAAVAAASAPGSAEGGWPAIVGQL
jgi:DNA polymerase-3 subunit gamma/tau